MSDPQHLTIPPTDISQGREVERSLQPGLREQWMFLSPDGRTLAAFQPALGGHANFLHQIDLTTGDVASIKLLEDYRLTIPIVPSREPKWHVPPGYDVMRSIADLFPGLIWRPGSSGFAFTLGYQSSVLGPDPEQLYYVDAFDTAVLPLASRAPGIDIGHRAEWSPDGQVISYQRSPFFEGTWLIEMATPDTAFRLLEEAVDLKWSDDSTRVYFEDASFDAEPPVAIAREFQVWTRESRDLYSVEFSANELVLLKVVGLSEGSLVVYEAHAVADDPTQQFPNYIDDPARSRLVLVHLQTLATRSFQFHIVPNVFLLSPDGSLLLARSEDRKLGMVIDLAAGDVIHGPSEDLFYARDWSPDSHLLAMRRDDEIFFFDVTTGLTTPIAPEFEGEKIFLGWVPDPSIYPLASESEPSSPP